MANVALAFLWHQHQPYYPDDLTGENPMPWVRLHAVKDYYGMALHLLEVPEMQCTINLVPSLVMQLLAYVENNASDRFLDLSRLPAESLTAEQAYFVIDNFFMAQFENFIRPRPRYLELFLKRDLAHQTAPEALRRFNVRDLRDLQVWFNLAWIHPLAFERDADLAELRLKGKMYTEEEKLLVLDKHRDIMAKILPLHKQLVDRGQVELTTTPFYHPILPLLIDKKLAREAMPDVRLPRFLQGYPEDAAFHVREAVAYHAQVFGQAPKGMWPAEGSVCQPMIPLLSDHGIKWIATDEEILSQSTKGYVSRDQRGHVRNPQALYQPSRVSEHGKELSIVFRDHALSDLIGFHYQRSDSVSAAEDFISKLRGIGSSVSGSEPALVPVILDGENCWEHYPGNGVAFLRTLYQRCVSSVDVKPVRIMDYLEMHPPRTSLPYLAAGSWINHNFDIWIGHHEDNTAWDLLHRTRDHLVRRQGERPLDAKLVERAWREIYIAEGSDWNWWYGPQHSSAQDGLFDFLFRRHLQNVYHLLGEAPPDDLHLPIAARAPRPTYTQPRSFLEVKVDGRRRPIEWMGAGVYLPGNERGTMAMATAGWIHELHFGFTPQRLLIRLDFEGSAKAALANVDEIRVLLPMDPPMEVVIEQPGGAPRVSWYEGSERHPDKAQAVEVGIDQVATIAIPFDLMHVPVDGELRFCVDLRQGGQSRERAPREEYLATIRPSPDFERINWDV